MTHEEAKILLGGCERVELQDHAFGDAEVCWTKDGAEVASGYFGETSSVSLEDGPEFTGREADDLRSIGKLAAVRRNDSIGPAEFVQGRVMPGLTPEDVYDDLMEDDPP